MSKEKLEFELFKDFLDGNFHGSCGKFAPLNWGSNKIVLPKDKLELIDTLYNNYRKVSYKDRELSDYAYNMYQDTRYKLYFEAWKEYLKNKNKKTTEAYRIVVNSHSCYTVFVRNVTKRHVFYTEDIKKAKVFKKSEEEIKELLKPFTTMPTYKLVSCIEEVNKEQQLKLQFKKEHKSNPMYYAKLDNKYIIDYGTDYIQYSSDKQGAKVFTGSRESILDTLKQVEILRNKKLVLKPCV